MMSQVTRVFGFSFFLPVFCCCVTKGSFSRLQQGTWSINSVFFDDRTFFFFSRNRKWIFICLDDRAFSIWVCKMLDPGSILTPKGDYWKKKLPPGCSLLVCNSSKEHPPLDFGVYGGSNSTACYTNEGSDHWRKLFGKHSCTLSWDRDTMAPPPDDLRTVHVKICDVDMYGWMMLEDLMEQNNGEPEEKRKEEALKLRLKDAEDGLRGISAQIKDAEERFKKEELYYLEKIEERRRVLEEEKKYIESQRLEYEKEKQKAWDMLK